jgi:hypothetical protein
MNLGHTPTPDALERALHASLKAVDPGAGFTTALEARLAAQQPVRPITVMNIPQRQRRLYSASLGLAASIVMALGIGWQLLNVQAEERAQLARAQQARLHMQVLLALEITSERLGQAQRHIEQYQLQEKTP